MTPPEPLSTKLACKGPSSSLSAQTSSQSPPASVVHFSIDPGAEWAEIRVEDSGPGVPKEIGDKVFEPFFTTKTERGGTGLGLAITRDMIAQLGGEIGLENLEHGGARATIRLQKWQETEPSS